MAGLRSLIEGSAASLLGTAVSAALSVVYISLGARLLGPASYASVAVAISTANIVFIALNPVEAGLTLRIAGYAGRGDLAPLRAYLQRSLRGLTALAGLVLSVWVGMCVLLESPVTEPWLALFCCATLVANLPRAALRGRERFSALAINWILESATRIAIGLILIALAQGASGMVAGYALGTVTAVVHGTLYAYRGLPKLPTTSSARMSRADVLLPLKSLSPSLMGLHFYTALVVNVDVLAASHFLPAREAGMYGGSASIARIVLVGAQPLMLVVFSRLAAMSAARADTRRVLRFGGLLIVGGLSLSLLIPVFGAELLLQGFLGSQYSDAAPVLLVQWATACVLIAQAFVAESMLATSKVRGAPLFALPTLGLFGALALFHHDALVIAQSCFVVCVTMGSATFYALWRLRLPLEL